MRAIEIIERVDELEPNLFGIDRKLAWLSELDGQVYNEIGASYEPGDGEPKPYISGEEELLIGFPYGESIYGHFLKAMMAADNFETGKYNQHIAMFESAYGQYRDMILRTKRHRSSGRAFIF